MLLTSRGPGPWTLHGVGRRDESSRADRAAFVMLRFGRGDGELWPLGRREDGLKDGTVRVSSVEGMMLLFVLLSSEVVIVVVFAPTT